MTTTEKLVFQIFEAKKRIIEEATKQRDFYHQHLVSKLIIDGITPPPWLLNPNSHSHSDPQGLTKEELISELLLPLPRPTVPYSSVHCSEYSKPGVTGDNGELSNGSFMQTHVSNKGLDKGDGSTVVPESRDNDIGCALNCLPELDVSATSPKDQTEVRISNIYTEPDQSLARIHRSKSRQKALKLRNNASTEAKRRLSNDNNTGFSLNGIALSRMDSPLVDNDNGPLKLAKTSGINRESSVSREAKESDLSKENDPELDSGRISRSRSSYYKPICVNESLKFDLSSEAGKKYGDMQAQSTDISLQKSNHVNRLLEVVNPSDVTIESFVREATSREGQVKEKGSRVYHCRTTRSSSSTQRPNSIDESAKLDASLNPAREVNGLLSQSIGKSMQQLDYAHKVDEVIEPSGVLGGRKTRSRSACSNVGISKPVNSSSIAGRRVTRSRSSAMKESSLANSLNRFEGYACQDSSGSQVIAPSLDNQEGQAEIAVPPELASDGIVEAWPLCSRSNLDGVNSRVASEGLASQPPSEGHMIVKPKQLDFYDIEEFNLNKLFSPSSEKKRLHKSLVKMSAILEPAASRDKVTLDNPNNIFLKNHAPVGLQVSNEADGACKNPFESNNEDFVESEKKKFKSHFNENAMLQNIEDDLESDLHKQDSTVPHEIDVAVSDAHKSSDEDMHQVKYPLTELCPSSTELRIEEKILVERQVSSEADGACKRPIEPNVEDFVESGKMNLEFHLNENASFQNIGDDIEAVLHKQESTILYEVDAAISAVHKSSDVNMHQVKCPLTDVCQSSLEVLIEEDCMDKEAGVADITDIILDARSECYVEDDDNLLALENKFCCGSTSDLVCTDRSPGVSNSDPRVDDLPKYGLVDASHSEDDGLAYLKLKELQLVNNSSLPGTRFGSAKVDSWPQFKRRKVEDQLNKCYSVSPSFRLEKLCSIHGNPTTNYLKSVETKSDSVLKFQEFPFYNEGDVSVSSTNKSFDLGTYPKLKCHLADGINSSTGLHIQECGLGSEERSKVVEIPSTFQQERVTSLVSSLTKQADVASQFFFTEDVGPADLTSNILDARDSCDGQDYQRLLPVDNNVNPVNADGYSCAERTLWERKSHLREDRLLSYCSVGGANNNDLGLNRSDQTLPVFEGFILDAQIENRGSDIAGDGIDTGKLNIPSSEAERASFLEQICMSASMKPPLSHLSSTSKQYKTRDLYQSVPNGLLESMDLRSPSLLNDDAVKLLRASYSHLDDVNSAFLGVSYSDCPPCTGARFGWNSKNSYTPPIGKLRERISANTGSNPELTCFRIEEDPIINEENENADEVADKKFQEGIGSVVINSCAEREPLAEITEACLNCPASVSAAEKFPVRGSLDSVNTEANFHGTHTKAKQKLRYNYSNKRSTIEAKEKPTLSVGASGIKKTNESLRYRFSKPKLSGKTSPRKGSQRLSEKESKHNNIVSNITSFVPLVQQKQAAAVCTGKRDIKVKALEAAEAAKRLEEKKEIERKMKKEALKLERARIEQENLKLRELNKKKKEVEEKQKVANIAAKKRKKEEDERKDKERKRKRIEETRRPQKAQDKKLCAGKVVKETQCGNVDGKLNSGKESDNGLGKNQKMEAESRDDNIAKKSETEQRTAGGLTNDVRQISIAQEDCDTSSDCGDNEKDMCVLNKSEFCGLVRNLSQEKSYEMSPYQCSDDEDEEDGLVTSKKFVPSWASENCVALVMASQKTIDPCLVFSRKIFCNMDEVLLPRKLRQK